MRRTARRVGGVVLAVVLLAGACGCVQQKVHGSTITYTYEWWIVGVTLLGSVSATVAGWCLLQLGRFSLASLVFGVKRTGFGLLIGGPVLALMILPTVFTHYLTVDDDHFEVRHSWWWSPARHNLRFDQLQAIGVFRGFVKDGEASESYLDCVSHAGKHEHVELDPLVLRALPNLLKRAEQRGVKVVTLEPLDDRDDDNK
jgi:hypothetical protein